jgi:AcrR family transcriptional regulator
MMTPVTPQPSHSWAGTTLSDRRAQRHEKLLDVGLELLGTQGAAAVTVRSVCRIARLTDRYFYESFADRDELVLAVFDRVAAEAGSALVGAVAARPGDFEATARAAIEAFLGVLTDDPRKGRVLLLEPLTDPTLGMRGIAMSPMFVELVRTQLGPDASPAGAELTATALIGALANLFIRWLDGTLDIDRAQLSEYCVRLLVSAADLAR